MPQCQHGYPGRRARYRRLQDMRWPMHEDIVRGGREGADMGRGRVPGRHVCAHVCGHVCRHVCIVGIGHLDRGLTQEQVCHLPERPLPKFSRHPTSPPTKTKIRRGRQSGPDSVGVASFANPKVSDPNFCGACFDSPLPRCSPRVASGGYSQSRCQ